MPWLMTESGQETEDLGVSTLRWHTLKGHTAHTLEVYVGWAGVMLVDKTSVPLQSILWALQQRTKGHKGDSEGNVQKRYFYMIPGCPIF